MVKQLRFGVVHIRSARGVDELGSRAGDVQREKDKGTRDREWGATLVIQLREREKAGVRLVWQRGAECAADG